MSDRHFENVVQGFCPMGCGQTLYRSEAGRVWCDNVDCTDDAAVHRLLEDQETEHIVRIGTGGFTIRHPLRERVNDELIRCTLTEHIRWVGHDHMSPGDYRATHDKDAGWDLVRAR